MTVQITSPVLGKAVGDTYTGTLEAWLLASGYAKQDGYTGPGVSNSGATQVAPADDPRLPENRGDKAQYRGEAHVGEIANNGPALTRASTPLKAFDFDRGGVDEDPTDPAADGDADGDASTPA